jgi:hypothetical protein
MVSLEFGRLNKTELCALERDQSTNCREEFIISIYLETSRGLHFSQHGKAHHFRSRYLFRGGSQAATPSSFSEDA